MKSAYVLILILLLLYQPAYPETNTSLKPPIDIEADVMSYDWENNEYIAEGNVTVKSDSDSLTADKIIFKKDLNQLELFGDVSLKFKQDILKASYARIYLENKTAIIEDANLFIKENNIHIKGDLIEKTGEATYRIKHCIVSTCDQTPQAWSIYGSEVEITVDGYGKVYHSTFRTNDFPLLYSPVVIFPAKSKRQSGLLIPRIGFSSRLGTDIELPFFWNISTSSDFTFYQRYMSNKGYMQGIEYRYARTSFSKGVFMLDVSKEGEKKAMEGDNLDISPYPRSNFTRYWLRGKLNQELPFKADLRTDFDIVSDQDFLRELEPKTGMVKYRPDLTEYFKRPSDEKYSMFRENTLSVSKEIQNQGFVQFRSSYFQRPEDLGIDTTPQPLLGLFGVKEWKIKDYPVHITLGGDDKYVYTEDGKSGNVLHINPNVRASVPIFENFTFSPVAEYDIGIWSETLGNDLNDEKKITNGYHLSSTLSTMLHRIYSFNHWGIDSFRHIVIPSVELSYYHYKVGDLKYPWFDQTQLLDMGKALLFRMENSFTGKVSNAPSYRRIASLVVEQGLILDPGTESSGKKGDLSPLSLGLVFEPVRPLEVKGDLRWDHQASEIESSSLSANIPFKVFGTKENVVSLTYVSELEKVKTISFDLSMNLPYGIIFGSSLNRDMRANEAVNSSYYLGYKHQCYGLKFVLDTSRGSTQWGLFVELLGIGQFGGKF